MTKYVLAFIFLLIVASLTYKFIFADDKPSPFKQLVKAQKNPFSVPIDSSEIAWARARQYFIEMETLIGGGQLQETDSVLFLPYFDSHKKGDCIRIERKTVGDSVVFKTYYWYSKNEREDSAKEIALYIKTGRGRYDKWKSKEKQ